MKEKIFQEIREIIQHDKLGYRQAQEDKDNLAEKITVSITGLLKIEGVHIENRITEDAMFPCPKCGELALTVISRNEAQDILKCAKCGNLVEASWQEEHEDSDDKDYPSEQEAIDEQDRYERDEKHERGE